MAKALEQVRETLTPPRRRWLPWQRQTLTGRIGGVTEQAGQTASDLAATLTETLTPSLRSRWLPWRRRKTLANRLGDVTGQVGQTASSLAGQVGESAGMLAEQVGQGAGELAEQVGQTTSELVGRARERTADIARRSGVQNISSMGRMQRQAAYQAGKMVGRFSRSRPLAEPISALFPGQRAERMPYAAEQWYGPTVEPADLSAERAAEAAELAADAAQRAVGLMERMSGWIGTLAMRVPQAAQQPPLAELSAGTRRRLRSVGQAPGMMPVAEVTPAEEGAAGGMTGALKRAAMTVGERISEWSDGRYGLETGQAREVQKAAKARRRKEQRQERQARRAAKESERRQRVSWLPWVIGLSLGLMIGLVGVAYWQRQRLQRVWGQTSQRMQQATESMRQRLEASRGAGSRSTLRQTTQPGAPQETTTFTPFGSAAPVTDIGQQGDGKRESAGQEDRSPSA